MEESEPFDGVIRQALPNLHESEFQKLMEHMAVIGVRTEADLQFVTVEDLKDVIPLIISRKMIHHMKNRGESVVVTP